MQRSRTLPAVGDPSSGGSRPCPSSCPSDSGRGEALFWGANGDPDPMAGQSWVPPWQVPGKGSLQGANVPMERSSCCPSSPRGGQQRVVSLSAPVRVFAEPPARGVTPSASPGAVRHPGKRHRGMTQGKPPVPVVRLALVHGLWRLGGGVWAALQPSLGGGAPLSKDVFPGIPHLSQ